VRFVLEAYSVHGSSQGVSRCPVATLTAGSWAGTPAFLAPEVRRLALVWPAGSVIDEVHRMCDTYILWYCQPVGNTYRTLVSLTNVPINDTNVLGVLGTLFSQVASGQEAFDGMPVDIWALGCTLFRMLLVRPR
jgi:serine/threonine protein kinase